MAATGAGYGLLQTGISLGTVFNALAAGADAITAALTLPIVTNATSASVIVADLELLFSASVTWGTGAPYLQGTWINADSGTNYDGFYGVVSGQLYPINIDGTSWTYQLPAGSASGTVVRVPGIVLPRVTSTSSALPKFVLYYNGGTSGPAFPATVTASIYPAGDNFG